MMRSVFSSLLISFLLLAKCDRVFQFKNDVQAEKKRNKGNGSYEYMSACFNSPKIYLLKSGKCDNKNQIAVGRFKNSINESGWAILEIETFHEFEPKFQAYAAGLIEGILTREMIYNHYRNTLKELCVSDETFCKRLFQYLQENLEWIKSSSIQASDTDVYWKHVNLTFLQVTGVYHGYVHKTVEHYEPTIEFRITPIYMTQLYGDLIDLSRLFNKTKGYYADVEFGKCSALIKVTEDNKDLLFSHVAMSGYESMTRILKLYKFGFDADESPGNIVSFSGYPGSLTSQDDFCLMNSGLATMETTIRVFNNELYSEKLIKPERQLHYWIRNIVANRLARTAPDWVKIFGMYNSGTYNNQWMVLDYKMFKPGHELPDKGLLWILEQIPGLVSSLDVSWILKEQRYWPSYNLLYQTRLQFLTGAIQMGKQYDWYNYDQCPRAKMFKRDQNLVKDMDGLQKLMRYNDYKHDELSKCKCNPPYTAEASISTRGDLNMINGSYELPSMGHRNHGAIDYKGTNYELFKKLSFAAWGGPTYDPLPVFSWETTNVVAKHYGQPTIWNFKPVLAKWQFYNEL